MSIKTFRHSNNLVKNNKTRRNNMQRGGMDPQQQQSSLQSRRSSRTASDVSLNPSEVSLNPPSPLATLGDQFSTEEFDAWYNQNKSNPDIIKLTNTILKDIEIEKADTLLKQAEEVLMIHPAAADMKNPNELSDGSSNRRDSGGIEMARRRRRGGVPSQQLQSGSQDSGAIDLV